MRARLLAGAVLALLLVVGLQLGPERSVFSSGRLSPSHRTITCAGCHDAFTSFANDTECLRCHREERPRPAGKMSRTRCVVCHLEHRAGRPMPAADTRRICLGCHGTAEVDLAGPALEFHPHHRGGRRAPPIAFGPSASHSPCDACRCSLRPARVLRVR